jgi:hypothetical protein
MKFGTKSILLGITIICILALASSKRSRSKGDIESDSSVTSYGSAGSGNVIYLDKHDVRCGSGRVLTSFKLNRTGNNIRYQRSCLKHPGVKSQTMNKETSWNLHNGSGGSTNYLDRHHVDCPTGFAIQRFQLKTSGSKIRYEYTCVAASLKNCNKVQTGKTDAGSSYENYYLDRQNVSVPRNNQAMTGFRLLAHYKKNPWYKKDTQSYSYEITVCDLIIPAKPVPVVVKPKPKPVVHVIVNPVVHEPSKIPSTPRNPIIANTDYLERNKDSKKRRRRRF